MVWLCDMRTKQTHERTCACAQCSVYDALGVTRQPHWLVMSMLVCRGMPISMCVYFIVGAHYMYLCHDPGYPPNGQMTKWPFCVVLKSSFYIHLHGHTLVHFLTVSFCGSFMPRTTLQHCVLHRRARGHDRMPVCSRHNISVPYDMRYVTSNFTCYYTFDFIVSK